MIKAIAALVLGATLLAACTAEEQAPPVLEVVVDTVAREPFQPVYRHVGRLQAENDVAIQARVTGYLVSRDFREGELVQAGDVLYTIDASEYEAALARAKADLAAAEANQVNAEGNYERGKELLPKGAISQSEMDNLKAKKRDADARIESAKAQVTSAAVNLSYTRILAPITGRIGHSSASVGDLVGPNSGNLTTLVSIDPIDAVFQVSEATYVAAIGQNLDRDREIRSVNRIEVTLELTNGAIYPEVGHIYYIANRIDQSTGTLETRARIPNPHSALVPGQYVRVILRDTELREGLFLPQSAVQADQQGSFVLAVAADGTVERHNVTLGERREDKVLVEEGIEEGAQVIVRGLQQVRPKMVVKTKSIAGLEQQEQG
ncbi:MAG: efflux RND transporter periplasmic adaptor subunit [Halioglobus sp.]|nr:efflux RND transporter periplasmic adaptor subunit [Halioglobus sp.]